MIYGAEMNSQRLTVAVGEPLVRGGAGLFEIAEGLVGYEHTITAFGGFESASFSYSAPVPELEKWFETGLGRTITVYDDTLTVVWEGFVDSVTLDLSGLQVTRGPLTQVANRVEVVYSSIDTSTTPPSPGVRKRTAAAEDAASQSLWGVWPRVVSISGATDDNALAVRDLHLNGYREPETSGRFRNAEGRDVRVTVHCKGWMYALNYPVSIHSGGTVTADAQIKAVLALDPNGWISPDCTCVDANGVLVSQWQDEDNLALSIIKGITAMGDDDNNRRLFGLYAGRMAEYRAAPDAWSYEARLGDGRRTLRDETGGDVPPWVVRPGRWLFFSDFLPGRIGVDTNLAEDPRMLFIETVTYRMPIGLEITGGRARQVGALLARLGLGGGSV